MKSVMQEASSIAKAIEQGWIKANKPQEFSVKILEEPQRNFIGMTIKSAKVALFFNDKTAAPVAPQRYQENKPRLHEKREKKEFQKPVYKPTEQVAPAAESASEAPAPRQTTQPLWNDAMLSTVNTWVKDTLRIIEKENITFTVEQQNFHIRITFSQPIMETADKEKHLLASFSTLIIETLKRQFRMGLKGHKIVLTHAT
ncbi:MAG: hypothetical protein WC707_05130 [Candidatus Babeliaceae bacterium]